MELRYLKYFLAVAEEMNFGRAAKRLHISQPPLSRQIQALERELGTTLLDRSGSRFRLTAAGLALQDGARRLLDEVEGLENSVRLVGQGSSSLVRVGFVGSMMLSLLPDLLAHFARAMPDTRLDLVELATDEQAQAILAGRIDLGFLRSWTDCAGLRFDALVEEPFSIIYPEAMLPAGEARLADFASLPFVGASREAAPGIASRVRELCSAAGFELEPRYVCSQLSSVLQLVSGGLGWTILPAFSIKRMSIEGARALPLPEKSTLGIAYRLGRLPDPLPAVIAEAKVFLGAYPRLT